MPTEKILAIDASVALTVAQRGWSRLLQHLDRTIGVNLGATAEAVRGIGLTLIKEDTATNEADIGTKPLAAPRLEELLPLVGFVEFSSDGRRGASELESMD